MPTDPDPTITDLHTEQAKQGQTLTRVCICVEKLEQVLIGPDGRSGVITDVDRLKRSRALSNKILWAVFVAALGIVTTGLASAVW